MEYVKLFRDEFFVLEKLDPVVRACGLDKEHISIRMTGCPNGCARSRLGEMGLIGRAVGKYNLYLGVSHHGDRLNTLYREMLSEAEVLEILGGLLKSFAADRAPGSISGTMSTARTWWALPRKASAAPPYRRGRTRPDGSTAGSPLQVDGHYGCGAAAEAEDQFLRPMKMKASAKSQWTTTKIVVAGLAS